MSKVVGIDLGTTNSLVAYVKDGVPLVIRDRTGDGLVPSVVSSDADGTVFVGREAQRRLLTDARRTAYSVKRFMGKGRDDVSAEAAHFPFRIGGDDKGVVRIGRLAPPTAHCHHPTPTPQCRFARPSVVTVFTRSHWETDRASIWFSAPRLG